MKTIEQSRARMTPHTNDPSRPWVENYAVFLKPTPGSPSPEPMHAGFVGVVREMQSDDDHLGINGCPEFGYMLDVKYQGKGVGTEAVMGFLDMYWGLEARKDVKMLIAVIDSTNLGSLKVVKKIGGQLLGSEHDEDVWGVRRPESK